MATAAFEVPGAKSAWYANEAIDRYEPVMIDTDGKYAVSDGSGAFVGICQYGGASGEMVTVVKGIFPGAASEVIAAGDKITVATGDDLGTFKIADTEGDVVYGIAITAAAAIGDLFTIHMLEVPMTIPAVG